MLKVLVLKVLALTTLTVIDTSDPESIRQYLTTHTGIIIEEPTPVLQGLCASGNYKFAIGWNRGISGHGWPSPVCGDDIPRTEEKAMVICTAAKKKLLWNWQMGRVIVCY